MDSVTGRGSRISILMTTYAGETAANLRESLESLAVQSVPAEQLVLVADGVIGLDQEEVLAAYARDPRIPNLRLVRLERNLGLARALNAGLPHCDGDWVMRMDSDDRCRPDRIEVQRRYLEHHPEIDVLSAWCHEFEAGSERRFLKTSPVDHDSIVLVLRWRNALVHSATVVRRTRLLGIGGYRADFGMLEDYDLYVRLLLGGARFHAVPAPLLECRKHLGVYARRGGFRYLRNDIRFRLFCYRAGFLSLRQFGAIVAAVMVFRAISGPLRASLYSLVRAPGA